MGRANEEGVDRAAGHPPLRPHYVPAVPRA